MNLLPPLQIITDQLISEFNLIPEHRQEMLHALAIVIRAKTVRGEKIRMTFICTHNSRRSHIAQLWAMAAANYYDVPNVECYSGGTEATFFNPRAVRALKKVGFEITTAREGKNPRYEVSFASGSKSITAFSKKYDDPVNPNKDFFAIMTCSEADENCPVVAGSAKRISITYQDPKASDDTVDETVVYDERVQQIGREMLFIFSLMK